MAVMKPRERVLTALNHEEPDRVPVDLWFTSEVEDRLSAEHGGLRVDPRLPTAWNGYRASRRFRDATYAIEVRKPAGSRGRVSHLLVDGRRVEGSVVPVAPAGSTVTVVADLVEP